MVEVYRACLVFLVVRVLRNVRVQVWQVRNLAGLTWYRLETRDCVPSPSRWRRRNRIRGHRRLAWRPGSGRSGRLIVLI